MELKQMDHRTRGIINSFIERSRGALAGNLKSIVLYGSFSRGEYSKRHSDLNILLVLDKVDLPALAGISRIKRVYKFRNIAALALSRSYLENSTDTFPIEFSDMRESYVILWGEDYIKGLKIDLKNLRHQCEWELKTKIIQMQQLYVNSAGSTAALRGFLIRGLPSFMVVFKNILRLKGKFETNPEKILEMLAGEFSLNKDVPDKLWRSRGLGCKIADVQETFGAFLEELRKLSDSLDRL